MRNNQGILDVCTQYVAYNTVCNIYSLLISIVEAYLVQENEYNEYKYQ